MIMKVSGLLLLIFFCTVGIIAINQVDKEKTWNIIDTSLSNAYVNSTQSFKINPNATGFSDIIVNIVYKICDMMIYTAIQCTRIASRLAIENPQINFWFILNCIWVVLILMILVPLIKLLAVIYVLIYDFIKERKYKKEMKILEDETKDYN